MRRIICIGNALVVEDRGGLDVLERLRTMSLPDDVELIDGGLAGLDLLRFVEDAERVVFVDCMVGDGGADGVMVLDRERVAETCEDGQYHHAAGLPWLLKILPDVVDREPPPISVVGIAPRSGERTLSHAAAMCLHLLGTDQARRGIRPADQGGQV